MLDLVINELISIGKTGYMPEETKMEVFFKKKSSGAYHIYDSLNIDTIPDSILIYLFKGLVIAEKELSWHCGSTSPSIHVYQHINSRNLDTEYSLADWAFQYSDNEYIPFGFIRHGEKTAYEYIQWKEDFHNRLIQDKLNKEYRKERQLERAKEIAQKKQLKDKANREYYERLMKLPPHEQIETIISDNKHILYFYIPVIYKLLEREDITKADLDKLIFGLWKMKPTPFRQKVAKLIHKKLLFCTN